MIVALFMPVIYVNASVPSTIYKGGTIFSEALNKTMLIQRGVKPKRDSYIKVIEGGTEREVELKTSDIMSQAMDKAWQEVAYDTWDSISGNKLEKTPLKNMPGWSKVIIGTAAFATGGDIILDIWDKIQSDQDIDFVTKPIPNVNRQYLKGFYVDKPFLDKKDNYYKVYVYFNSKYVGGFMNQRAITDSRIESVIEYPDLYRVFYSYYMPYNGYWSSYSTDVKKSNIGNPILPNLDVDIYSTKIPSANVVKKQVPEIDTSREKQILIIPDPEFFPDIDGALLENPDMVENPVKWLQEHPEHDPTPEDTPLPEPKPEIQPQPKYIPNPFYDPDLEPSVDNPKYVPNPEYDPANKPIYDPTNNPEFDPITGSLEGKPIESPSVNVDLPSFFNNINNAFKVKYPEFNKMMGYYDLNANMCGQWEGLNCFGLTIGNIKFGDIQIVSPQYVNAISPKIKSWIGGVIWFFLGLYLIRKISTVWGSGR
ncbi:hypothetical protein [Schinkia azotoformans]|nr:hypothetical protein [Schinkia azotoformans]MEC1785336.1 hypothetical protein [Schinkia azotoformans]